MVEAHGDGAHAEQRAFHGAGDGARVGDVLGQVGAVVDARQHEIRRLILQHVAHAHDDAIGRRAAHGIGALADLAVAQRHLQREGVRGAGLVHLGRDDPHVVGQRLGDLVQHGEAVRSGAVVVGD